MVCIATAGSVRDDAGDCWEVHQAVGAGAVAIKKVGQRDCLLLCLEEAGELVRLLAEAVEAEKGLNTMEGKSKRRMVIPGTTLGDLGKEDERLPRYAVLSRDDEDASIMLVADDWEEVSNFLTPMQMPPWPHDGPTIFEFKGEDEPWERLGRWKDYLAIQGAFAPDPEGGRPC